MVESYQTPKLKKEEKPHSSHPDPPIVGTAPAFGLASFRILLLQAATVTVKVTVAVTVGAIDSFIRRVTVAVTSVGLATRFGCHCMAKQNLRGMGWDC